MSDPVHVSKEIASPVNSNNTCWHCGNELYPDGRCYNGCQEPSGTCPTCMNSTDTQGICIYGCKLLHEQ